jgi:hypothetical protein
VLTFEMGIWSRSNEAAFYLTPGQDARELTNLMVFVEDGGTSAPLEGATVEILAERVLGGRPCVSSRSGACALGWAFCIPTRVRGSKPGYQTGEMDLETRGGTCPNAYRDLVLTPLPGP